MSKIFDNKIFKFIYTAFKTCFIILIVLYLSFVIVQRLSGNRSIFGYRLFNVVTMSMSGVYDVNDVIIVKDWDTSTLEVGDDVAYNGTRGGFEGKLITHRIVKKEKKADGGYIYVTKGVASTTTDPSIEEDQILGKVVGVLPIITPLNHLINTQVGFFLMVFLPLVLVIVLEVLQTITDIRLEKNEIREIEDDEEEEDITESISEEINENDNKVDLVSEDIEVL